MPTFKNVITYIAFFLSLSFGFTGFGQSPNEITFSNWQKKDGLPSNHVNAVVKDKLGFLWIATNDGLCRYDGPDLIKVYRHIEGDNSDSNRLKSSNIRSMHCDSQGFLWLGTRFGGLTRFNPSTNEWKTFQHDANQENSLSHDEVLTVLEDSKQRIWVGTEKGLNLFDRSTSTFTRFKLYDKENNQSTTRSILTVMEDQQGWIWAGTWAGGLHLILEDDNGQFRAEQTRFFQTTSDQASNNVWSLLHDNQGRYWVGSHGGGLLLMNLPASASNQLGAQDWQPSFHKYLKESKNAVGLASNSIQVMMQDRFDDLWLGTTHGLYRASGKNLPPLNSPQQVPIEFEMYLYSSIDRKSIVGNNVMDLLEDDQGLIWVATTDGISQYNWYSNQFSNFNFSEGRGIGFAPNFFVDKDKNIWTGALNEGLFRYEFKNDKIGLNRSFNHLLLGKQVSNIHSPDREWLYVGTELGITAIELKTLKTIKYPIPAWIRSNVQDLVMTSILVDKDGFIWFGSKIGLYKIDPATKAFSSHRPVPENPNSISDDAINHIMQTSKGDIWIGTYKGLNRIVDPSKKELAFEKFVFSPEHPEKGPVSNQVMFLKEVDKYLYVGTLSGICRYDFSTKLFEWFNAANQKYWVRSIEEGLNNNLWLGTNEGLYHFDVKKKSFRAFDKKDGLSNIYFQLGSSDKDSNGHLYFAHHDGFTCFSPEKLTRNKVAPPVFITEIEKMTSDGTIVEEGIHKDQIILNHDDYRLSINFAGLNYNRPDKNQYAYRLIGFEEQWNEAKLGIPIVYTNLAPKTYTLEVKAANNDGIWNEEGTSITIVQRPAFWETWWFRLLGLLLSVAIVSLYTNNIRKNNENLKAYNKNLNEEIANRKRVEQQLSDYNNELKRSNKDLEQFAYIASHDLKEPLRVIGSFSSLLSRRYRNNLDDDGMEYIGFIEDGVKRMSNLIHSLLTYSIVGQQDSVYDAINLTELLELKITDLSQLVKDKNALIQLNNLPEIIGQEEQIGMVFFNLINNAIKFNTQEQPQVIIREEVGDNDFWKFSVADNGIGIDQEYQDRIFGIFKRLHGKKEYEGTGIGLAVCQKIILRHQGTILFESIPNEGSTFYFTIKKNLPKQSLLEEKEEVLQTSE